MAKRGDNELVKKYGGRCRGRNVSLPEALDKLLLKRAQEEDRPISWVMRRALVEYLTKDEEVGDDDQSKHNS